MTIDKNEVEKVAQLSKLKFSEEELVEFTDKMDKIVSMMSMLDELDTTDVALTVTPVHLINVMREDVIEEQTDRSLLMKNVPEQKEGFIRVPAIMQSNQDHE